MAAALAAERLGLAHNPPRAVARTRDKAAMRAGAGRRRTCLSRDLRCSPAGADVLDATRETGLPCVIKPLSLSGSRGVIRADDAGQAAWRRPTSARDHGRRRRTGRRAAAVRELPAGRRGRRRRPAALRTPAAAGDLRQARPARGPLLRGDPLRHPVTAPRRRAGRNRADHRAVGDRARACARGRSTRSCASTARASACSRSRPARSADCARARCASASASASRS